MYASITSATLGSWSFGFATRALLRQSATASTPQQAAMPYRAPNSHVWFRSPSPIYSPPTPPAEAADPMAAVRPPPKQSALLQAIDDAAAITFDISPISPTNSSHQPRKPNKQSSTAHPTPLSTQRGISDYMVTAEKKGKRKASTTTYTGLSKKHATQKIVFDRIPAATANNASLPIVAGLRKQQDLADRRRSQVKASIQSLNSTGSPKGSKIKSSRADVKAVLKSEPQSQEVDKDWLLANLDVLLPPLSKDDIDELEDEDEVMEVSSSTPHIDRSSPRLPSPRSFATFGRVEQDQTDDRLFLNYSPPSSPIRASDSIVYGLSIADNDEYLSYAQDGASIDSRRNVAHSTSSSRPSYHPLASSNKPTSSSSTAYSSVSSDPYNHPDFSHSSEADWSTLPTKRSLCKVPQQSKIALSKKFTLPSRVFGQAPKVSASRVGGRVVEPLPLKRGVKLFKPSEKQAEPSLPLYTVHTQAGMRFGPLIDGDDKKHGASHAMHRETSPTFELKVGQVVDSPPTAARLSKFAFDTSATQLTDWSEFGSLSAVSEDVAEPGSTDDPDVNYLKLAPYFDALKDINSLSPPASPPASPTLPFSLSGCRARYPVLRLAIEEASTTVLDPSELTDEQLVHLEALVLDHYRW